MTFLTGCASTRLESAKHIILVIGDGMQLQHEIATSRYLYGTDNGLSFHKLPYRGYVATWDVTTYNQFAGAAGKPFYDRATFDPLIGYDPQRGGIAPSPVGEPDDAYFLTPLPLAESPQRKKAPATDSASSATAYATGFKTDDGNIAWLPGDPPNGAIVTIAEKMRAQQGAAIGVVSSVPFSHATPASFVSHNVSRENVYTGKEKRDASGATAPYAGLGIADEIINLTKPDVVIGGGHPAWNNPGFAAKNGGYISPGLYESLKTSNEYVFIERQEGVDGGKALRDGATAAIQQRKKLFGLFGGADGAFENLVPANQPGAPALATGSDENPRLADAAVAALEVLGKDPDGLFLMVEAGEIDWANHGNDYARMIGATAAMDAAVQAIEDFVDRPGDNLDWSNTLLIVTADHANSYMRLSESKPLGAGALPEQKWVTTVDTSDPAQPVERSRWDYPGGEVSYHHGGHTNELVTLYAKGKAAAQFDRYRGAWYGGDIVDNTHLHDVMADAARIR